MKQLIASFNGGEVTPLLEGRTDLQALTRSCRLLRNFIPQSGGAAIRRPSLLHVDSVGGSGNPVKLVPFVADAGARYVVGISIDAIKVWNSSGELVFSGDFGVSGDNWSTYPDWNPDAITTAQVNDVLFIAHSSFPPIALKRLAEDSWEQTSCVTAPGMGKNFWPAVLDESVTVFDDQDAVEGWTVTKTTSASQNYILGGIHSTGMSNIVNAPNPGFWRLYTGTTAFTGTIVIQGCDTWDGTYKTLYTITNASSGALTVRKEWFHHYAYMKLVVTRSGGTLNMELRHVGSQAAPSVWCGYTNNTPSPNTIFAWSSPSSFGDYAPGECFQLAHRRIIQQVAITVVADASDEFKTSKELYVLGKWELYTTGSWAGDVFVEAKESTGAWRIVKHVTSNSDQNWSVGGESPGETLRVRCIKTNATATSSAAVPRFVLVATDGVASQFACVQWGTADSQHVEIKGMKGFDYVLAGQATTSVFRGAFSNAQGYPAAVCIHDQRVYFAGTKKRPTTIWASSVNDLFNFRRTGLDDGGFMFELASNEGNPIQWMLSASRGIIAGTAGDEWLIDGADTGVTATNITARRQSRLGSAAIQAIPAVGSTIFVQRGGMHLQEYQFAWETQQFQAVDLTELCKHLTQSGIRAISFSQNPEPTLWAVMNDGSLLTCTYNRAQEVIAWAKHSTQGTFESVCVTYGDTANADDVWFVVLRDGNRYLEKLDSTFYASLYNGGRLYHLDAAKVKTGSFSSVDNLDYLEGMTVSRIADGIQLSDVVVSGGVVSVPSGTTHAVVGLSFDSELQPMPFDLPLQTGTTQGRTTHTPQTAIRLYRTDAAKYADKATAQLFDLKIGANTSGLVRFVGIGAFNDSCELYFKSKNALPLNIVAVIPSVNVYGE